MGWWKRARRTPPPTETAATANRSDVLAGLTSEFVDAGIEDAERVARRAAAAGLEPDHIKTTATARFIVFRARNADQAKRFLLDDLIVDTQVTYFVVETPEGIWGKDIDGLYLENLLPWQRDIEAAEYEAAIITLAAVGNPSGTFMSASTGTTDNYTVEVECGRCQAHWWDGVRYRDFTAVRCPACRSLNRVDSRGFVVERVTLPTPEKPSSRVPPGLRSPLTAAELTDPRRIGQRLLALDESTEWNITDAQRKLRMDRDYLDTRLASGEPLDAWVRAHAEIRAIGYQLDREGGMALMRRVHYTLDPKEHRSAVVSTSYLWDRIGQWRD